MKLTLPYAGSIETSSPLAHSFVFVSTLVASKQTSLLHGLAILPGFLHVVLKAEKKRCVSGTKGREEILVRLLLLLLHFLLLVIILVVQRLMRSSGWSP